MEKTKYEEGSLEYKIEKVYTSFFNIKKFKKLIDESQKKEIIEYLRFYTTGGCLGVGIGWSRENHTIVDIDKRGIHFNHDESHIYKFSEMADLLIKQYGRYRQLSLSDFGIS